MSKIVPIFLWLAVIFCDTLWHHGRKGRWAKSVLFYHFMSIFITDNHMISLRKLGFDSRRNQNFLIKTVSYKINPCKYLILRWVTGRPRCSKIAAFFIPDAGVNNPSLQTRKWQPSVNNLFISKFIYFLPKKPPWFA